MLLPFVTSKLLSLFFFFRQCALAALRDVKSYLKEEGGQVAVRFSVFFLAF